MSTFIDGIGASECIDSSGEVISVAGMDISSLDKTGSFTWEHQQATGPNGEKLTIRLPDQVVGKILKAKKIFTDADCDDDRQRYFWSKVKVPYIYVMGELFDDYKDSAKDVAGMFRYDFDRQNQNEHDVLGFSVEGSYLKREGMLVTHSIARKVTICEAPCNKTAIAEMIPAQKSNKSNGLDSIFKTEPAVEIELFKSESPAYMEFMKKKEEMLAKALDGSHPDNKVIGYTKSGKTIESHNHMRPDYNHQDHFDAEEAHSKLTAAGGLSPTDAAHHKLMQSLHRSKGANKLQAATTRAKQVNAGWKTVYRKDKMTKSLEAGSGMAAPSQLTGGAALQKEGLKKAKARANEEYQKWGKREEFVKYMQKKLPHLARGEIDAIGKTLCLKKSLEAEKSLAKMVGLDKSVSDSTQTETTKKK